MTDEELAKFLGIENEPKRAKVIASLSENKRKLFERMATLEIEVKLWQEGLGPKPTGVLLDMERDTKRRRAWD
jgi:hypothetical protein